MASTNYNEFTGQQEYWNNATNQWTPYDSGAGEPPETFAPSKLTLEDIKNRVGYKAGYQPWDAGIFLDSTQESSADPSNYYRKLADDLVGAAYGVSSVNQDASDYLDLIEGLKDIDPKTYYTAKIDYLSRNVGHNIQSNETGRANAIQQQLKSLIPEATQAGLTPEEINATYGSGYTKGRQQFATILNLQQQEQKGTLTPLIEGIKFVGPGLLGMYGIDALLTAGLGAASGIGAGAIDSTAVALGGAGGGGAFVPALGSGASFAITPGVAYGLASGAGSGALGSAGALTATQALPYTEAFDAWNLAQQGLNSAAIEQNLVATGLNSFLAADVANLAAQGLSPEAIAQNLAYSYSPSELAGTGIQSLQATNSGLNTKDILSNINRARNATNTLSKLVKNPADSTSGSTGGTSGMNTQQLASLLGSGLPTQSAPGGLYRMNENPFIFGNQGQSVASQGTYDVSGTNPMANALRKA
jgi:hypothetical protein